MRTSLALNPAVPRPFLKASPALPSCAYELFGNQIGHLYAAVHRRLHGKRMIGAVVGAFLRAFDAAQKMAASSFFSAAAALVATALAAGSQGPTTLAPLSATVAESRRATPLMTQAPALFRRECLQKAHQEKRAATFGAKAAFLLLSACRWP